MCSAGSERSHGDLVYTSVVQYEGSYLCVDLGYELMVCHVASLLQGVICGYLILSMKKWPLKDS